MAMAPLHRAATQSHGGLRYMGDPVARGSTGVTAPVRMHCSLAVLHHTYFPTPHSTFRSHEPNIFFGGEERGL